MEKQEEVLEEAVEKQDTAGQQEEAAEPEEPADTETDTDIEADTETEQAAEAEKEDAAPEDAPEKTGREEKKSRKKAKAEKKDAMKEKVAELEDKVMRQMAEFENFRKRTEKEKTMMFETGARSVLEKILPVVDNFERGLSSVPEEEKNSPFAEGMAMVYKQLMGELEKMEVKPIEALGKEFDPNFHNAVMQAESDEYETGVVAQELQKGYMYRDTVIRHSMVAVVP